MVTKLVELAEVDSLLEEEEQRAADQLEEEDALLEEEEQRATDQPELPEEEQRAADQLEELGGRTAGGEVEGH